MLLSGCFGCFPLIVLWLLMRWHKALDFSFTDLPFDEALPRSVDPKFGPASLGSPCCRDAGSCFQCRGLVTGNHVFDDLTLGSGNDYGIPPIWELPNSRYEGIAAHGPEDIPITPNLAGPQNEGDFTGLLLTAGDLPSDFGSHFDAFFLDCS